MLNLWNCANFNIGRSASAFLVATFISSQLVGQAANQQSYQGQTQQGQTQQDQSQQAQAAQFRQQQQQRPNTPQLTPEQRAAQQRAAMQSRAQQRAAQEAYAAQLQKKIVQPAGFPLSAEHTKYVDDLLTYWEKNSTAVNKYKCNFRRFEYDPGVVQYRDPRNNQLAAHSVAFGEIRFAAPDRARYETNRLVEFKSPPAQAGADAKYDDVKGDAHLERWICDGESIFEFDFEAKRLYDTKLPREMQGNVAESPLPFIFGGKKGEVLQRYWVRSATPKGVENEYWLELYPKRAQDARIYSKIELVIAKEDFLPKAMHMYDAQYKKGNEKSKYFTFENRVVNNQWDKFKDALGQFVNPKLPGPNWKRVARQAPGNSQASAPPQYQGGAGNQVRQASGQTQNGPPAQAQRRQ